MSVRKKVRKSLPEYTTNPSVQKAAIVAKTGVKRIPNAAGDKCMIVSEHGEILAPAGVHEIVELDRTQFVKMFPGMVAAIKDLSKAAYRVFELVYEEVLQNGKDRDIITLYHRASDIPRPTFERGLTELLEKEVLYKTVIPFQYFINISFMFNGNRLAYLKEYRIKGEDYSQTEQQVLPM